MRAVPEVSYHVFMRRRLFMAPLVLSLVTLVAWRSSDAGPVLACSGPGAFKVMADVDLYANRCALGVEAMLVMTCYLLLRGGRPRLAGVHLFFLLVLNPAWTVSAWKGDCGDFKATAATVVLVSTALTLPEAAVLAIWFREPWPWQRPRSSHCPACGYNLTGNTSGVCPECGTPTTAGVKA